MGTISRPWLVVHHWLKKQAEKDAKLPPKQRRAAEEAHLTAAMARVGAQYEPVPPGFMSLVSHTHGFWVYTAR